MIARLQKSLKERDKGFTLVELLVVIVIIGILAGIAIPLFLNQRKKGVDAGMKSDLKALATVEETHYVDALAYTSTAADLATGGFKATTGNDVEVAASATSYCLRAANPSGTKVGTGATDWYYYSPSEGGLVTTTTACAPTAVTYTDAD